MIAGDAGRLLLGNGAAQAIAFAGMAGISRMYNAGAIGQWSTCVAFVTFMVVFAIANGYVTDAGTECG